LLGTQTVAFLAELPNVAQVALIEMEWLTEATNHAQPLSQTVRLRHRWETAEGDGLSAVTLVCVLGKMAAAQSVRYRSSLRPRSHRIGCVGRFEFAHDYLMESPANRCQRMTVALDIEALTELLWPARLVR
jgi:hypothetical protein